MLIVLAITMKEKCHISTNLKFLRKRVAQSQQKLSIALGIKRGILGHYETGVVKNIPSEELIAISDYFNIPVDALLKVDISKLPKTKLKEIEGNKNIYTGKEMRIIVTTVDSNNKENIEYVPVKAKAGYSRGYCDPEYISKLPVFNLPHLPKDRKYRMFPTEGDSMLPIPEGVMVIGEFVEDWLSIKNGELCIVVTQNEGIVFKQIINTIKEKKSLTLQSLNPVYKPYSVPANEIREIWKYKSYISDDTPGRDISLQQVYEDVRNIKEGVNKILIRMNGQ